MTSVKLKRWIVGRNCVGRLGELAPLERLAFPYVTPAQQNAVRFLQTHKHVLIVAERDGVAVGYVVVLFGFPQAQLYQLVVSAAHRGRGIGSALLVAAERYGRRCAETMTLEVREDNHAAIALYHSRGFHECGRSPGYYSDGAAAVHFTKVLRPAATEMAA